MDPNWRNRNQSQGGRNSSSRRESEPQDDSKQTNAVCNQLQDPIRQCTANGMLRLANGQSVPIVTGAFCTDNYREDQRLPLCKAYVGDTAVTAMRDTGCSGVVVKRALVSDEQLTGAERLCELIDRTVRTFPIAKLEID